MDDQLNREILALSVDLEHLDSSRLDDGWLKAAERFAALCLQNWLLPPLFEFVAACMVYGNGN